MASGVDADKQVAILTRIQTHRTSLRQNVEYFAIVYSGHSVSKSRTLLYPHEIYCACQGSVKV